MAHSLLCDHPLPVGFQEDLGRHKEYDDALDDFTASGNERLSDEQLQQLNNIFSRSVQEYSSDIAIRIW